MLTVDGEATIYLDISCRAAFSPRVLQLSRQLSKLFEGQQVQLLSPREAEIFTYVLRVPVTESDVQHYWPRLRAVLEDADLLDECRVVLRDTGTDETTRLWPPES